MKRRDVIKLGALAAGAGLGAPGCSLPRMLGSLKGPEGAAAFDAMLDEQLGHLAKPGFLQRLAEERTGKRMSPEAHAKLAEKDEIFRRLLGTLMISQGFRDLPEETQLEPAVQDRMWRHIDQIASTPFEVSDMLADLDPEQRKQVQRSLRENPELPMELAETLDGRAARAGVSHGRRMQLRSMMSNTSFRLRHQDPGILIDEYVDKVQRLRASGPNDAAAIELAQKFNERAFWRHQHLLADEPGASQQTPASPAPAPVAQQPAETAAPAAPVAPAPPPAKDPLAPKFFAAAQRAAQRGDCKGVEDFSRYVRRTDPEYHANVFVNDPAIATCLHGQLPPGMTPEQAPPGPRARPGAKGLKVGAYLLGIGVVVGGLSAAVLSTGSNAALLGAFGLTAAVILVAMGLIWLLVSAIIYARHSD
jgi:hypothetical protein